MQLAPRPSRLRAWAIPAALITVVAALLLPTLAQPLVSGDHGFRQTQTAFPALVFAEQGIDVLRPLVPVLGPPWLLPFEFPIFQVVASVPITIGLSPEVAVRGLCLAAFLLSAALLWRVTDLVAGRMAAHIALALYLFMPFSLIWGRSGLMEYVPICGVLGFVLASHRWHTDGSRAAALIAVACALVAMLVKPTTVVVWMLPALWLIPRIPRPVVAAAGLGIAAGLAWTAYADALKSSSPATAWLSSAALLEWNFGSVELRTDPATWTKLATLSLPWLAAPLLPVGLAGLLAPGIQRRVAAIALSALVVGPLIFTNLYAEHSYYWIAVSPAAAILVGIGGGRLVQALSHRARTAAVLSGLAALAVFGAVHLPALSRMYLPVDDPRNVLPVAAEIAAATRPDELVMIHGYDWSPELLFYAGRWGYMVREGQSADPTGYRVFRCEWMGGRLARCPEIPQ